MIFEDPLPSSDNYGILNYFNFISDNEGPYY
jgi:hypothetical protein